MFRRLRNLVLVTGLVALAGVVDAQERADYPRLRAALHEMREARRYMKMSRDDWPPTHRDRALQALEDAINSVKTILGVRNVEDFRGVDRKPDYYKRYKDQPLLRAALDSVREARDELRRAKSDFRGMKDRAYDDLDLAAADILILLRNRKPRP